MFPNGWNEAVGRHLFDDALARYIDWREACARVNDAYRSWASETGPCGSVAFGLYLSALDAEQQAAEVYAGFVRRADELPWSEDPPARQAGGPAGGVSWQ